MKTTPAENTLLHAILAAAIATIIAAGTAAAQFYYSHGQDLWLTLVFFGGSLATTFGAIRVAVWHAIITNPATPQAERDAESQAMQLAQAALAKVENLAQNVIPFLHSHPTPVPPPQVTQPIGQGMTSKAVTSAPQKPMVFPQPNASATAATSVPSPHFDTNAALPVVTPIQ